MWCLRTSQIFREDLWNMWTESQTLRAVPFYKTLIFLWFLHVFLLRCRHVLLLCLSTETRRTGEGVVSSCGVQETCTRERRLDACKSCTTCIITVHTAAWWDIAERSKLTDSLKQMEPQDLTPSYKQEKRLGPNFMRWVGAFNSKTQICWLSELV